MTNTNAYDTSDISDVLKTARANLFMMFAPLEGWRHVKITGRHTAVEDAHALKDLSGIHFPDVAQIVLVQITCISFYLI